MSKWSQFNPHAEFSKDKDHRYSLSRSWAKPSHKIVWLMFNPSTGNEKHDDPTIRFCIDYTRSDFAECDGIEIVNLFSLIESRPSKLTRRLPEELRDGNFFRYLDQALEDAKLVIAAWGCQATLRSIGNGMEEESILNRINDKGIAIECLKLSNGGVPIHPRFARILYYQSELDGPRLRWYPGKPKGSWNHTLPQI